MLLYISSNRRATPLGRRMKGVCAMSMSTISIGLAHEFIIALVKRGVTKEMISAIISNCEGITDELAEFITARLNPKFEWHIEELDLPQYLYLDLKRCGFTTIRDLYDKDLEVILAKRNRKREVSTRYLHVALSNLELPPLED